MTLTLIFPDNMELKEFKPCVFYNPGMDCIIYLLKDVSYVAEYNPEHPFIEILKHNNEIVGFQIHNPSHWVKECKNAI